MLVEVMLVPVLSKTSIDRARCLMGVVEDTSPIVAERQHTLGHHAQHSHTRLVLR